MLNLPKNNRNIVSYEEALKELCSNLIYHGRHFNPKRDSVVIMKSVDYLFKLMEEYRKDV